MPTIAGAKQGPSRHRPGLPAGFWPVWTAVAVDLLGFGIIIPLLPLYAERLGASSITVGALFASYSVAQVVVAPLWGRLSDRIGRRPTLLIAIVGSTIGSLVLAFAGSLGMLFAGRIIDGISGASAAVARATVADLAPVEDRPRLMGLIGAAYGVGMVAGPAIGGLAALGGPAIPFLVAAAISFANLIGAVRRLEETRTAQRVTGASLLGNTMSPAAHRLVFLTFMGVAVFSVFETTFALLASRRLGASPATVGLAFAGFAVVWALAQGGVVGPVTSRWGERTTIGLGMGTTAVGFVALGAAASWPSVSVSLLLIAVGQGLLTPALSSALAAVTGADHHGRAMGIQQSASGLARVVGPLAGGALFAFSPTTAYLWTAAAGLAALPVIPAVIWRRRSP